MARRRFVLAPRTPRLAAATGFTALALLAAHATAFAQEPCVHGTVRDPSPAGAPSTSGSYTNYFGIGVALDGARMVIGKGRVQHPSTVYVYELDGSNWFATQELPFTGSGTGYGYGQAIALSGSLLVTADAGEPLNGGGRAYVFEEQAGVWTPVATLAASDEMKGSRFGASVATDETRIVVAATRQDNATGWSTGAVYVFEYQGAGWVEVQKLAPTIRQNGIDYGAQIELFEDWLFVSVPRRNSGQVYVYRHDAGVYTQTQLLRGSTTSSGFGTGLAMDGATLLAYQPGASFGTAFVRAFELVSGSWTQVDTLRGSDGPIGPRVAADGGWAAAVSLTRRGVGAVYLFRKDPTGWNEVAILEPSQRDANAGFGTALALSKPFVVATAPRTKNGGTVETFTVDGSACRSLSAFPRTMSIGRRGLNVATLDAGAGLAGAEYVVLSSLHGTSPGIPLDGLRLPLNPGAWFSMTATPFWTNALGVLDEHGQAVAWLDVPALRDPGMAWREMNHAFVAFSGGRAVHVSNTTALRFVP